ncbi:nuclease-related domain protein [Medicago truncatula]|uniref:Nuclease-related domain protein n=1 Tax=Medicago truncatula TaxID=3880 RepID=G7J7F6_MEDTR|nr:nuclease-related domain protein [Medicago truncatula]
MEAERANRSRRDSGWEKDSFRTFLEERFLWVFEFLILILLQSSPQTIDLLLLTKRELRVISVKNFSGILTVQGDGRWACEKSGKHNKVERHPDPVEEVRKQASILQSYLEQRGAVLTREFLTCKVILPNPTLWYVTETPVNICTFCKYYQFL